jgi:hypothetical protein
MKWKKKNKILKKCLKIYWPDFRLNHRDSGSSSA